jgi:hypothetical protein
MAVTVRQNALRLGIAGARGESAADIARRLELVDADATDQEAVVAFFAAALQQLIDLGELDTSVMQTVDLEDGDSVALASRNRILVWSSADDLDLPVADDLPDGFFCSWLQVGPGIIHFEEEGGGFNTYLKQRQDFQDSAGPGSFGVLIKIDGTVWISGDVG